MYNYIFFIEANLCNWLFKANWRYQAELNRSTRCCRPLPDRSAMVPYQGKIENWKVNWKELHNFIFFLFYFFFSYLHSKLLRISSYFAVSVIFSLRAIVKKKEFFFSQIRPVCRKRSFGVLAEYWAVKL